MRRDACGSIAKADHSSAMTFSERWLCPWMAQRRQRIN